MFEGVGCLVVRVERERIVHVRHSRSSHILTGPTLLFYIVYFYFYFLSTPGGLNTELKQEHGWSRYGYALPGAFDLSPEPTAARDTVERVHVDSLTEAEFIERFERPGIPAVITGCADDWPATTEWTEEVRSAKKNNK